MSATAGFENSAPTWLLIGSAHRLHGSELSQQQHYTHPSPTYRHRSLLAPGALQALLSSHAPLMLAAMPMTSLALSLCLPQSQPSCPHHLSVCLALCPVAAPCLFYASPASLSFALTPCLSLSLPWSQPSHPHHLSISLTLHSPQSQPSCPTSLFSLSAPTWHPGLSLATPTISVSPLPCVCPGVCPGLSPTSLSFASTPPLSFVPALSHDLLES